MVIILVSKTEQNQARHIAGNGQPEDVETSFGFEAALVALDVDVCDEIMHPVSQAFSGDDRYPRREIKISYIFQLKCTTLYDLAVLTYAGWAKIVFVGEILSQRIIDTHIPSKHDSVVKRTK